MDVLGAFCVFMLIATIVVFSVVLFISAVIRELTGR